MPGGAGRLVVLDQWGRTGRQFPLSEGAATIGKASGCDIRVLRTSLAPHHATIVVHSNQAIIRNVGDGETLVNGKQISVVALQHEDVITVGDRRLRWEYTVPPATTPLKLPDISVSRGRRKRAPRRATAAALADATINIHKALEIRHRASMPGNAGGKQVAIVQPQRRDMAAGAGASTSAADHKESPQRSAPNSSRSPNRSHLSRSDSELNAKGGSPRSPRHSQSPKYTHSLSLAARTPTPTPTASPSPSILHDTTKATLWIESRKSSPRKSVPNAVGRPSLRKSVPNAVGRLSPRKSVSNAVGRPSPRKSVSNAVGRPSPRKSVPSGVGRRATASAKKRTPLRLAVLRKAQSARKVNVTKIAAPLKMDAMKQAALMLMAGRGGGGGVRASAASGTSVAAASPRGRGRTSKRSRTSKGNSVSVLEITDNTTLHTSASSVGSPLPLSPRKSALKDPTAKHRSRKNESIKFDLSNLENYNEEDAVVMVSASSRNEKNYSSQSVLSEDLTLHYTDTSTIQSPSPRRPIHSRTSKMMEQAGSPLKDFSLSQSKDITLTPESPRSRKSLRGSIMLQKALDATETNASTYSHRTTKTLTDQSFDTTAESAFCTRTMSPRSGRNMESYSIVDLVSVDSAGSGESASVYDSIGSTRTSSIAFGTPQGSSRKTRSTIDPNILTSSTPYVGKTRASIRFNSNPSICRSSPNKTTRSSASTRRSKSLTTPENSEETRKHISINSTKISRASRSRSRINDSDLQFLNSSIGDSESPRTSRRSTVVGKSGLKCSSPKSSPRISRNTLSEISPSTLQASGKKSTLHTNLTGSVSQLSLTSSNTSPINTRRSQSQISQCRSAQTSPRSVSEDSPRRNTSQKSPRKSPSPKKASPLKSPVSSSRNRSSRSILTDMSFQGNGEQSTLHASFDNGVSQSSLRTSNKSLINTRRSQSQISPRTSAQTSPRSMSQDSSKRNTSQKSPSRSPSPKKARSPKSPVSSSRNRSSRSNLTNISINSLRTSLESGKKSTLHISIADSDSQLSPRRSNKSLINTRRSQSQISSRNSTPTSPQVSPRRNTSQKISSKSPSPKKASPPKSPVSSATNRFSRSNLTIDITQNAEGGIVTPENRNSPTEIGTPVLSIQSLLDSSQSSFSSQQSPRKSRGSNSIKRKTIGVLHSGKKARTSPKSNLSSTRKSLRLIGEISALNESVEENVTPKSAVKLVQEAVKNKHSTAKKPQSKRSIIDNLNESDFVKQLFNSPVKRKLSQSMTEFSRNKLFDDDVPQRPTRKTIALGGKTPDDSLLDNTDRYTPDQFVSPLSTPGNSPKRLSTRNTPQNLTNVKGVKKIVRTPRTRKSVKNDLRNVSGVKAVFAKSPRNRLSDVRIKEVFTKSPRNDLRRVTGVKSLFQSEQKRKSPRNDLSDVRGVRLLFNRKSVTNDLRNVSGAKKTLQNSSPKNDLRDVRGVKRLFQEQKSDESADLSGVEELFDVSTVSTTSTKDPEALFDQLIGKPPIKNVYSKSFISKRPQKKKFRSNSLRKSIELITNNVDQWIQQELEKSLHKDKANQSRKSNVSRELQKLTTDTVEGTEIRSSRIRNCTLNKSSNVGKKRTASDVYSAHTLPIKKRSFVEASLEKSANESKVNRSKTLPIKKRAVGPVVHSTPVKGRHNLTLTMNASELGRVSPIALLDATQPDAANRSKQLNSPKHKSKRAIRGHVIEESDMEVVEDLPKSPKQARRSTKTESKKAQLLVTQTTKSPRGKNVTSPQRSTGNKSVIEKSPVLSPKGRNQVPSILNASKRKVASLKALLIKGSPKVILTRTSKVISSKASPKVVTPKAKGRRTKASVSKVTTEKSPRASKVISPKASPKVVSPKAKGRRTKASVSKVTTEKSPRSSKVISSKASPKVVSPKAKERRTKASVSEVTTEKSPILKGRSSKVSVTTIDVKQSSRRTRNNTEKQDSKNSPKRGRGKKNVEVSVKYPTEKQETKNSLKSGRGKSNVEVSLESPKKARKAAAKAKTPQKASETKASPKKTRADPLKPTRTTRNKTEVTGVTNTKRRRQSLVITKKAPVISSKLEAKQVVSPKRASRKKADAVKLKSPAKSPKATTPKVTRPRLAVPKPSPKLNPRGAKAKRNAADSSKKESPKKPASPKRTRRNVPAESPKETQKAEPKTTAAKKPIEKTEPSPPAKRGRLPRVEELEPLPKRGRTRKNASPVKPVSPKKQTKKQLTPKAQSPSKPSPKKTRGKNISQESIQTSKTNRRMNTKMEVTQEPQRGRKRKSTDDVSVVPVKVGRYEAKTTRGRKAVAEPSVKATSTKKSASPVKGRARVASPAKGKSKAVSPVKAASPVKGKVKAASPVKGKANAALLVKGKAKAVSPIKGKAKPVSPIKGKAKTAAKTKGRANAFSPVQGKSRTPSPVKKRATRNKKENTSVTKIEESIIDIARGKRQTANKSKTTRDSRKTMKETAAKTKTGGTRKAAKTGKKVSSPTAGARKSPTKKDPASPAKVVRSTRPRRQRR